jgi:hypothetical protein
LSSSVVFKSIALRLIVVVGMNNEQALDIMCEDTIVFDWVFVVTVRKVAGSLLPEERPVHQSVMFVYLLGSTPRHKLLEILPGRHLLIANPSTSGPNGNC